MFLKLVERLAGKLMDQADAVVPLEQLCACASQQGNVYAIVVGIAMVQHNYRAPPGAKHAINFSDRFCRVGSVMQYAVRVDQIKTLVSKVEVLCVCRLKLTRQI